VITMETKNEPRPGDPAFNGFRMRLPEDCVEYMLFVVGDKILTKLEAVRKAAIEKADSLTKDYIWQREAFNLETKIQGGMFQPPYPHVGLSGVTTKCDSNKGQDYHTSTVSQTTETMWKTNGWSYTCCEN
jgi:hypothetical protein